MHQALLPSLAAPFATRKPVGVVLDSEVPKQLITTPLKVSRLGSYLREIRENNRQRYKPCVQSR